MGTPLGWKGTVIDLRQMESSNPNQIPARGETKVFWLLRQSLVATGDMFNSSSYAACREPSPLRKKPSGAKIPAVLVSSSWMLNSLGMANSLDYLHALHL